MIGKKFNGDVHGSWQRAETRPIFVLALIRDRPMAASSTWFCASKVGAETAILKYTLTMAAGKYAEVLYWYILVNRMETMWIYKA
jgi:hypothetical protein